MKNVIVCLLVVAVSACVSFPQPQTAPGEHEPFGEDGTLPETDSGGIGSPSAASILVQQSRTSRAAGEYGQAMAAIERALRIEPHNPYLWVELGQVHLASGNRQQAAALAQKAMSMAGEDAAAQRAAQRLMEQAAIQ